jgi:hypothetical protein
VSLWNRIGEVATTVTKNGAKFTGEVFGAATAPARFAWDVATAPWNDDKEYNGFINTFKSAGEDATSRVVKPLASAGGAIMKVPGVSSTFEKINEINQEYIREPATTVALVQGEINKTNQLAFFDPNVWRKAYKGAQDISFGQAIVGAGRNVYDPKFNIYDPAQREAAFNKSAWGKYSSGAIDLGIQFFGDVTLAAGKAGKVLKASQYGVGTLKNADVVAKAAEDITMAQYGVKNRFTKVLDDFTANDSAYAISHPMVKSSSQPGLLAYMLGQSKTVDETSLVLRSALGDPAAMDELAFARADITDALKAARGDLSAVDEYKLFAAPDGTGMIPFLNDNPAVIKEAEDNYKALAQSDQYFAKLMGLGEGGGSLTRTTGKLGQGVEDLIAQGRATKFYDKSVGSAKVEVYQPTPFHRLYQKVSWLQAERPAGLVDFNDADSYKEILATVNQTQKLLGYTPEQSRQLLDSYMGASTPAQRNLVTQNMESKIFRDLCAKYGIDEEKATKIYNGYTGARTSAMKSIQDKGYMVDINESILKVPQLESQLADYLPVMDFALMNKILKRDGKTILATFGKGMDKGIHYADVMQDAFKAGALLRLGYTIRNGVDSQLRMISAVGALNSLGSLGPGLKNFVYNTVKEPARLVDRYRKIDSGRTFAEINEQSTKLVASLDLLKAKIGELEAKVSLYPDDAELATELNTMRQLRAEKLDIYNHNAGVLARSKKATPKQRIGTGSFEVVTADGEKYILDDAFGGPLGDMFRRIASSGNSFERMVDSNSDMYARTVASKGIQAIRPTDKGYFDQWAQTMRQQFGNSAVVRQITEGKSLEDITDWLVSSPKGRELRKELSIPSGDAAEYVTRINNFLDQYLPVESGLRGKMRELTADDLRTTFQDPSDLPVIHGHLLEDAVFNASDKHIKKAINGAFKLLGTMPEDAWARSPLYRHYYREEVERRVNVIAGLKDDGRLTAEEQAKAMAVAHKVALRNMKNVLFNIERRSNLAAAMKYISPFFSAQENSYKTWLKLVAANPAIANRAYNIWQAPNRAGLVTDYEGNPVPAGQTTGNDIMWFEAPKGLTKIPGLNSLTTIGIPKGSLDIIFQGGMDALFNKGNPNFASDILPVGPYVAIPISEIVKDQPSLEESFKWALPFGTYKNAAAGLLPSWLQKQLTKAAGQSDPQFARTYQLIYETEKQKMREAGLGDKVDGNKIMKMTKQYWNMRSAANLLMPFAPQFNSPYKFYLDKAREYRRIYGINADAKFLNDYPDFFDFTTTLSKNPTGVQSSLATVQNLKEHSGLVADLVKIEPKLVGLIANDPNGYDFSQASYNYLYNKQVAPDSPDKFLSSQSPAEAQRKTDAEKGWIKYNQLMDIVDDELKNRGLSSVQEKGAEDLATMKAAMIQKLAIQTNAEGEPVVDPKTGQFKSTAWYDDYLDSDGSKTNRVIQGLGKIMDDKKFIEKNNDNPTWKSVKTYLEFRKIMVEELKLRDVKSIEAKANQDLKVFYDVMVNKLKNDDKMGFAYVYDRFLSQDLIYDKYLTPKAEVSKEKK